MTAPFPVAPGISLHVDPQLLGVRMDVDALVDRIRRVLGDAFKEPSDAKHQHAARDRSR
jgi:hypothetical protein